MRSCWYAGGSGLTGLARSAPTSNSSFWIRPSSAVTSAGSWPNVTAIPMAQFASSVSA